MKPDGSGTVYYPDGRIAVNIIAGTALEARKGQSDIFLSQIPYKSHQNRVAFAGG